MKVFYRVPRRRRNGPTVYEAVRVEFCCDEMERHWGRIVGFGGKGFRASTSRDLCLYLDRRQAVDGFIVEMVPVAFCPWCGTAVEILPATMKMTRGRSRGRGRWNPLHRSERRE